MLPSWAGAVTDPDLVFAGGPVAPDSALAVALCLGAGPAVGFKRLVGDYGLVDLDAEPSAVLPDLVGVRIFSGYAGWGDGTARGRDRGRLLVRGQRPAVGPAQPEPERLWRSVLRRQPGELAYVATYPRDATMN